MNARVYARTGADEAMHDASVALERSSTVDPSKYPFLAASGAMLAAGLRVDETTGVRIAMALSPEMTDRNKFIEGLLDTDRIEVCTDLLAYTEKNMDRKTRGRIEKEIALALGKV